jgi:protein transport protein SEC24
MKNPFSQNSSKNEESQYPPQKNNFSNETKKENFISNMKIEYYQDQNQISELNSQEFIRTSSESIPNNDNLIINTGIPFGINLTPFPDIDTTLISQYSFGGGNGIIPRCSKCKSFYNPYCEISNNYTSYKCNICYNLNEIKNIDINTLKKIENKSEDVYDIFANSDYIENAPMSSNFIFILDTTSKSINSGALKIFIETIRYIIDNHYFINEERTFVSFITFNNIGVSFYKVNKKTNAMQIFEISGDEPFIPDNKKNLIFPVDDNSDIINNILDNINNLYNINNTNNNISNKESEHLLFAIECGKLLLHNKGGKLIVLNSSNNWKNKIKLYEEIYYQNKNNNNEENNPFINFGKSLTKYQISCDIFQLQINGEMQDNQILINICNYSNGNFLFYKNFNENIHYKNLFNNIIKSVSNQKAYEIIIQYYITPILDIKQNLSIIPAQVNNSFLFPCININETFTFLLQYKEIKQKSNQNAKNNSNNIDNSFNQGNQDINNIYIQFGIIYTSLEGIRIIRIINKKVNVCFDKMEYIKNIDIESVCCIMIKFLISLLKKDRNPLNAMTAYKYKYYMLALSIFKQSNLNELSSSFILCYLGIMKHKFFCLDPSKYKLNIEEIKSGRNSLLKMKIDDILNIIVPKIYDITSVLNNTDNFENIYYQPINLNKDSIYNDKVYLIDNGLFLTFYFSEGENNNKRLKIFFGDKMNFNNVGNIFHSEQSVFEDNVNCDDFEVEKCKEIIDLIRNNKKNNYQDIFFSFAKSPSEALLKQCLILGNYCPWFQYSYKDFFNKL